MAKHEPKTTTATEPTIAPPPIVPDEVTTSPEIACGVLPAGVQMHDAGALPNTSDRARFIAPDPTQPPTGWKGTFNRCGGCGDFLGNAERCPKCAPARLPANVVNG